MGRVAENVQSLCKISMFFVKNVSKVVKDPIDEVLKMFCFNGYFQNRKSVEKYSFDAMQHHMVLG